MSFLRYMYGLGNFRCCIWKEKFASLYQSTLAWYGQVWCFVTKARKSSSSKQVSRVPLYASAPVAVAYDGRVYARADVARWSRESWLYGDLGISRTRLEKKIYQPLCRKGSEALFRPFHVFIFYWLLHGNGRGQLKAILPGIQTFEDFIFEEFSGSRWDVDPGPPDAHAPVSRCRSPAWFQPCDLSRRCDWRVQGRCTCSVYHPKVGPLFWGGTQHPLSWTEFPRLVHVIDCTVEVIFLLHDEVRIIMIVCSSTFSSEEGHALS